MNTEQTSKNNFKYRKPLDTNIEQKFTVISTQLNALGNFDKIFFFFFFFHYKQNKKVM